MKFIVHSLKRLAVVLLPLALLSACAGNHVDVVPVSGFSTERYLGKWYEIARLDHAFERGLSNVTAEYSLRADGKIKVLNQGYRDGANQADKATGKAKFAGKPSDAHLRVSFFEPFYGDYIIFGLDKSGYRHAYVSGGKDTYLWLLSRSPTVSKAVRADFLREAGALGYDTTSLIWVDQSRAR